jgi:predicted Rossmann fold flavoprotein
LLQREILICDSPYDVIVVGAGAAGLMAATSAASRGRRVLLLEKNRKLGVKILISGGTRCNITHNCDNTGIIKAFGRNGRFLHSALAALPPPKVVEMIEAAGVATKVEDTGKIFPVSDRAIDVRDALVNMAINAGATIEPESPVDQIERTDSGFAVQVMGAKGRTLHCQSLLITTGGLSYPGCGTTGDGYAWAQQFGHSIVNTVPALVPLLNDAPWANDLKGITIDRMLVQLIEESRPSNSNENGDAAAQKKKRKPKSLANREGSFLFTHFGFSGPAPLDVSREVARHADRKSLRLVCDFLPDMKHEALLNRLADKKRAEGKQQASGLLSEFFPRRLSDQLLIQAGVQPTTRNADLSKANLLSLTDSVKRLPLEVNGTLGFEKAEVTSGGVNLKEVDSKTMQSKLQTNLFFAGEVLDLDGYIGGFNFQSAFSTGWLAGQHV